MFATVQSAGEQRVQYESGSVRVKSFTFPQVSNVINTLLDRKARNNGVGRHLASTLKLTGECHYLFPHRMRGNELGFSCRVVSNESLYALGLAGEESNVDFLIRRLNARESLRIAIYRGQELAKQTRGTHKKGTPLKAVAGASRVRQKRHFQNSDVRLEVLVRAIAHAGRLTTSRVHGELMETLQRNGSVATLRVGSFIFRVEFPTYGRNSLVDVSGSLLLYTTSDNSHPAYRRLRNFLRKHFNSERKETNIAREIVLSTRRYRRTQQILLRG